MTTETALDSHCGRLWGSVANGDCLYLTFSPHYAVCKY